MPTTAITAFRRPLGAALAAVAVVAAALAAALAAAADGQLTLAPPARAAAPAGAAPALERVAAQSPRRPVTAIVQLQPGTDLAAGSALVRGAGGTRLRTVALINAVAARLAAADAVALASQPGVRAVSLDAGVERTGKIFRAGTAGAQGDVSAYTDTVRAPWAWRRGISGSGVGVAVVDTGIAGDLTDFRARRGGGSRVVATAVVNPDAEDAGDGFGHGTHIAGLVAGAGRHPGVAPDANLIAVKADDGHGGASVLDVIDGLQFVVDHRDAYGIRVVNLSLRSATPESYKTDPLDAAVEAAWNAGIVVVAAAGNDGDAADAVGYAPANDPFVITVGATDDQGTGDVRDDALASWSSRGTTQDGFAKPDVLAPGAHMVSTLSPGSDYTELCPSCVIDGRYFRVGGTSMAAGVVSGVVAAILQAHPDWTPDQVKATLIARSRPAAGGAEVALDRVLARPRPEAPANQGLEPNDFLDPVTGAIDYERASWSRASWSRAADPLRASWSRASWSRASWSRASWSATPDSCADLQRASWSRASWSAAEVEAARRACAELTRASWSRASWSRASWSRASWSRASWSRASWSRASWSRASWSRASWSRASWSARLGE